MPVTYGGNATALSGHQLLSQWLSAWEAADDLIGLACTGSSRGRRGR
jgi:hypothetical protein